VNPKRDPTDSDLLSTATLLLGTWADSPNRIRLSNFLAEVAKRAGEGGTPVIRPLQSSRRLPRKLTAVLDAVPGFHYSLEKGFMQWQYGSTDSGCYRHPCGSPGFDDFVRRQVQRQPKTYDDLEGELA
jgi:hypothetical protein